MKSKATKKEIMGGYAQVFAVGYCGLQSILAYFEPVAFTSGVYGWNSDIYYVPFSGFAVSTGYRPFGKHIPADIIKRYENDMKEFCENEKDYTERRTKASELFESFVYECSKI